MALKDLSNSYPFPVHVPSELLGSGMADTTNANYCTNCTLSLLQPIEAPKTRTERVEELLCQNHPPLDVELPAFREVVETMPAALEALDLKIVQARGLLDTLLSARQQALSHLEDAKALLHPMRSIPNEILADIFDHCVVKLHSDEEPDALDPRAAPWLLTGVCRRWRNLAINSPQLWTHLLLDFDKQRGRLTGRQCIYKVGLFNERSKGLPMTVYLGSTQDDVTDHLVLPCLEVSIPRWESLQVDVPRTSLRCLSGNSFSNLRKLVFYPRKESQWYLDLDVFQPTRVPALHEFGTDAWSSFGASLEHVALPWAQLTRVFDISVDTDGLDYFAEMTNVQELGVVLSDVYTPSERSISLPKLRRLSILEKETAAPGDTKSFFSTLAIPIMSELELNFPNKEHLCLFPTSNTGALEMLIKLDITCTTSLHDDNTSNLLDFLSLTHRVEQLRIYDTHMPVDLFTGLTFTKSSDSVSSRLPSLRILDIRQCTCDDALGDDISPIFDMLESRMPAPEAKNFTQDVNFPQPDSGVPDISFGVPASVSLKSSTTGSRQRRSCLRTVRVPRWLYWENCQRWRSICSVLEVECNVTVDDCDEDEAGGS